MKTPLEPYFGHLFGNSKTTARMLMLVVPLMGLGLIESRGYAQWVNNPAWTIFVPATAVSVAISTDRNSFSIRQQIPIKFRIANISNRPLYVPRAALEGCPMVTAHVETWLEDSTGRRTGSGFGGSCPGNYHQTLTERMNKEAALLKPGEHFDLTTSVPIPMGVPPGAYRVEAILLGWDFTRYNAEELAELAKIGNPFLRGEIPASIRVTLTP